MFKHILMAYDGSKPADKAFDYALDLAATYQAALLVLSVVRPPDFVADVEMVLSHIYPSEFAPDDETDAMLKRTQERYQQRFGILRDRAGQAGVVPEFQVSVGDPAEQIVRQAEEKSIDLIILGHRGSGLFERWRLGSAARAVMAYAHCPVMVVR